MAAAPGPAPAGAADATSARTAWPPADPPRDAAVRVAFLHPDLGLGGAERLVVDAATALAGLRPARAGSARHDAGRVDVAIVTAHYDESRCFPETRNELRGRVFAAGDWIPRHVLGGRFHVVLAVARTVWAAVACRDVVGGADALVVDQVAYAVPLLRWLRVVPRTAPVVFYCHFPDSLLAPRRPGLLRRAYRAVLDAAEESATGAADAVLVNSRFTEAEFRKAFPRLNRVRLTVLHPPCDARGLRTTAPAREAFRTRAERVALEALAGGERAFLLSLNRFERKKGLAVAIRALALLLGRGSREVAPPPPPPDVWLVMAGGYDVRVSENVEHLEELKAAAAAEGVADRVVFVPSCTEHEKALLLRSCRCLLYTPENEHFGIVPLEAGACARPVVACNSGGPRESVRDGVTGFLVEPTPRAFADACAAFLGVDGEARAREFGERARDHVAANFSRQAFGAQLLEVVQAERARIAELLGRDVAHAPRRLVDWLRTALCAAVVVAVVVLLTGLDPAPT